MAEIKYEPNELLQAADKMRATILEAQALLMHSAYTIRKSADMCYSTGFPKCDQYTDCLCDIMRQCEDSAKKLENAVRYAEKYREYIDENLELIFTPPEL